MARRRQKQSKVDPPTPQAEQGSKPAPAKPPMLARDLMMLSLMKQSAKEFIEVSRSSVALIITYLSFSAAMIAGLFSDYWMSVILLFLTTPAAGFAGLHALMGTMSNMSRRD